MLKIGFHLYSGCRSINEQEWLKIVLKFMQIEVNRFSSYASPQSILSSSSVASSVCRRWKEHPCNLWAVNNFLSRSSLQNSLPFAAHSIPHSFVARRCGRPNCFAPEHWGSVGWAAEAGKKQIFSPMRTKQEHGFCCELSWSSNCNDHQFLLVWNFNEWDEFHAK